MYMKFLNVPLFIVSLAIGLFVSYISMPPAQIIYVYPNPDNENKITFKDKAENCYEYSFEETNCPSNKKEINHIPIQ